MSPSTKTAKIAIDSAQILERIQALWLAHSVHDLSTPLSVARGYVRMALEEKAGSLPPAQRGYLIKALEQINKMAELTRDLRDFPAGNALVLSPVSFNDLVQRAADGLQSALSAKNVRLVVDTPGPALYTIGDSEKLAVALRGFLAAAVEVAGRGGKVRVEAGTQGEQISLRLSASGEADPASRPRPAELTAACRFWRLHGGSVTVNLAPEDGDVVIGELPFFGHLNAKALSCSPKDL